MSFLLNKLLRPYMEAASDDGSDLGGDRGDDVVVDTEAAAAATAAAEAAAEAARVAAEAEEAAVLAGKDTAAVDAAAAARDPATGKFAKKDDSPMIPKDRFDEQVGKERQAREAAERRVAELERQQASVVHTADVKKMEQDVKDLRTQERKAIADGNEEKAAEFSERADVLNRQIVIAQTTDMSARDQAAAKEDIRMDLTIERMETAYPELDEKSAEYNEEITTEVLDRQRGIMERERLSPSAALEKAAALVMKRVNAEKAAAAGASAGDDTPAGLKAAKDAARKETQVAKNLDAAGKQPAALKDAGIDSDKAGAKTLPVAADLTDEEFAALPEATRARMRGDLL